MEELFELMAEKNDETNETMIRIGIRMKVSGFETVCPVTGPFSSYDALEREIQAIKNGLALLLTRGEKTFQGSLLGFAGDPDRPSEEIWVTLSGMDEKAFLETFNGLEEGKRREMAEYVLTHCNVFSGNARIFSERYDEESALMG